MLDAGKVFAVCRYTLSLNTHCPCMRLEAHSYVYLFGWLFGFC